MLIGVGRFLHCACILKPGVLIHVYEEVCVYLLVHSPYVRDVQGGVCTVDYGYYVLTSSIYTLQVLCTLRVSMYLGSVGWSVRDTLMTLHEYVHVCVAPGPLGRAGRCVLGDPWWHMFTTYNPR